MLEFESDGPRQDRGYELWDPEPILAGKKVFLLAGGPSLTPDVAARLRNRCRIAINSSCLIAPDADVLFFTDNGWYDNHAAIVRDWPGIVVTLSIGAKRALPDKLRRFSVRWMEGFPRPGDVDIKMGRSSGHTAISVAYAMGCRDVVLVGYDMRVVDGREHHHTDYLDGHPRDLNQYERDFLPAFKGWNAAAEAVGLRVRNATPGSALHEFPMVDLDVILAERP